MAIELSENLVLVLGASGAFAASFVTTLLNWSKLHKLGMTSDEIRRVALGADDKAAETRRTAESKIESVYSTLKNIEVQVNGRTSRFEARMDHLEDVAKRFYDHEIWSAGMKVRMDDLEMRVRNLEEILGPTKFKNS